MTRTNNHGGAEITERFRFNAIRNARQLAVETLKAEFGYEKENAELDKKLADNSN